MQQYRIYCLNDEGGFSKVAEVTLGSDAEAIAYARALNHSGGCEIWTRNRLVAKVGAASAALGPTAFSQKRAQEGPVPQA
jgi:hypothetical protein